jgi:hypothetical protein
VRRADGAAAVAGHDRKRNITAVATNRILNAYNASLRNYVVANHYMDMLDFHTMSGRDLIQKFGYRLSAKMNA